MRQLLMARVLWLAILLSLGTTANAAEKIELHVNDKALVDRLNSSGMHKEASTARVQGVGGKKSYLHSLRGEALGLGTDHSFHAFRESTDTSGVKHTRYRQLYRNIPVFAKEVILHEDQNGRIQRINGSIAKGIEQDLDPNLPLVPAFSPSEALEHAKHLLSQTSIVKERHQPRPASAPETKTTGPASGRFNYRNEQSELNIYIDGQDRPRLVYYVSFYAEPGEGGEPSRPYLLLDATTRQIVKQWEGLTHQAIGTGPGGNGKVGQYEYGTNYGYLDVLQNGTTCTMQNADVTTVDMTGMPDNYATPFNYACPRNTVKTVNGAYSPLNDAHYFGSVIVNMYKTWYGFPPIPLPLVMRPHYGTNYENAFWDGQYMTFGDGYSTFYPLVSLDVAAHEVSHGFTEYNSNLIYDGESGGINESFSDMAGEAAKYFMRGSNDWRAGANITKAAVALRYLDNPPLDGYSIGDYSNYTDGLDVHYSSGIFNKAFYLLATKPGWTTKKAFDVMVKANADYWTPASTFRSAACGAITAATDLAYSSTDVDNAFRGVNVYCGAPDITTSVVPPAVIMSGSDTLASLSTTFSQTFSATGGAPPYTWSKVTGSLPPGLALNGPTGEISGIPTATGNSRFTLQVTDSQGRKNFVVWTITVIEGLRAGWPKELARRSGSGWLSPSYSPVFADLNGDGKEEIVAVDGNTLYLLNETGVYNKVVLPGPLSAPAVVDLDNDGQKEIVVTASFYTTKPIYAFHANLTPVSGFPAGGYNGYSFVMGSPVVAQLGNDGTRQIVAVGYPNLSTYPDKNKEVVQVVDSQGRTAAGWPKLLGTEPTATPYDRTVAVGDIDNDGRNEIVFASVDGKVHVFRGDGNETANWPIAPTVTSSGSPILADINGDGLQDIIVGYRVDSSTRTINVYNKDGQSLPGWPRSRAGWNATPPVAADLDGDGLPEIVMGTGENVNGIGTVNRVSALRVDGSDLPGWPVTLLTPKWIPYNSNLVVGDINGDGHSEVLINTMTPSSTCSGLCSTWDNALSAYSFDGQPVAGYPRSIPPGVELHSTPAIGDLDNNSKIDIALKSEDGMLYVWEAASISVAKTREWPMYLHDPQHSGAWLPSRLNLSPTSFDFQSVLVGSTSAAQTFTINNSRSENVTVSSVSITGPDSGMFTMTQGTCGSLPFTLNALQNCSVMVSFSPTSTGNKTAALTVASSTQEVVPAQASLSGLGTVPSFTLNYTRNGDGNGTATSSTGTTYTSSGSESVPVDTVVTLIPAPSASSVFGGWSGCDSVSGNTCSVTMSSNRNVTATFTLKTFTYTTTVTAGNGTITPTAGSVSYGGSQTFTITAGTGEQVTSFLDNGVSASLVTVNGNTYSYTLTAITADHTITVAFAPAYTLTYTKTGTGSGTVTSSTGKSYTGSGSENVTAGTVVTLSPAPSASSVFGGWSGCDTVNNGVCTATMSGPRNVTATFTLKTFNYTAAVTAGNGTITPSEGSVSYGGSQTFTVTPGSDQIVGSFQDNGVSVNPVAGSGNTYTYTLSGITADHAITVSFAPSSFSMTSISMKSARANHTATLLQNGSVLLAGGNNGAGRLSSAELYDPATKTFALTGSMTSPRGEQSATLLSDGRVLIAGGLGSSYAEVATAEIYNPATKTFTSTGSMNLARCRHTATLLANGKVLIVGGETAGGSALSSAAAELYDPATGTFTTVGNLLTKRGKHTATLLGNGKVLIAGGGNYLASAEVFDPSTGLFTSTSPLNKGRYYHTATRLADGRVLLAGGYGQINTSSSGAIASAELYDPATGSFSLTGALPSARQMHAAALLTDGTVMITGGFGSSSLARIEQYNPTAGWFTTTGAMGTARYDHRATALPGGDILVSGGYGSTYLGQAELFALRFALPVAIIAGAPAGLTNNAAASLTVGGTDVVSYSYKLDAGSYSAETAIAVPISLSSLSETSHSVSVLGKNSAGNWQVIPTTVNWTVDLTAPATTPTPSGGIFAASQNVTLSCNDGTGSGCAKTYYCFGTGCSPTTLYSTAIPITTSQVLRFNSEDAAGNSETVKTASYTIDTAPPATTATPGGGTYNTTQDIILACHDNAGSGCAASFYCLGAACTPTTPYSTPIAISSTTDLRFFSVDAAGNGEPVQTAAYAIVPAYSLTVTETGTGNGTVSGTDINCTTGSTNGCSTSFNSGTMVTLRATAASGSTFAGWSGECSSVFGSQCSVLMESNKNVTANFNACGTGPCSELIASGNIEGGQLNSLGEIVWSQYDQASGVNQIFSSQRGQLTFDQADHASPVINNLGDLVWVEHNYSYPSGHYVRGVIAGRPVTLVASPYFIEKADLNDRGEVVWDQRDELNVSHIHSNLRGRLTGGTNSHLQASVNNDGDVAFYEFQTGRIYLLAAGNSAPMAVTSAIVDQSGPYMAVQNPVVRDSGEVLWAEQPRNAPPAPYRLVSSTRGVVVTTLGDQLGGLDVNACGDLVYSTFTLEEPVLYRLGSDSPCMTPPDRLFALAVAKNPAGTGSGRVASTPAGLSLGSAENTMLSAFPANSPITLIATPDADSVFTGWSGACSGTGACLVTMDAAQAVTATFDLRPLDTVAPATTSTPGSGTYNVAQSVTLSCTDSGGSGCATTFFCLGAGCTPATPYGDAIAVGTSTDLRFYSTDAAGNSEPVQTVTFTILAADYAVNLAVAGTGTGMVTSTPAGLACNTGCSARFPGGASVTLHAVASPYSAFTGWSGACAGTGDCLLAMTGDRSVTATFTRDTTHPTKVDGGTPTYRPTIQAAYDAAGTGNAIRLWAVEFFENLFFAADKAILLAGGYDEQYLAPSAATVLHGRLEVAGGTVTVEGLEIRP